MFEIKSPKLFINHLNSSMLEFFLEENLFILRDLQNSISASLFFLILKTIKIGNITPRISIHTKAVKIKPTLPCLITKYKIAYRIVMNTDILIIFNPVLVNLIPK